MTNDPSLMKIERSSRYHATLEFWEIEFYTCEHMTANQIGEYALGLLARLGIPATVDYDTTHGSELHGVTPVTATGELKGDTWSFHCEVEAAARKRL